jgi:hypothetical protein
MNKPVAHCDLIPVREYAPTIINRRGYPVSVQYIYKLIALHKKTGKQLPFEYVDKGKGGIWIKK